MLREPKRPWAMFIHHSREHWGCEAYRMVIPAQEASRRGYLVDYMHFEDLQKVAARDASMGRTGVGAYDIYVFPRFSVQNGAGVEILKRAHKKLVFEVDDDFTNEHRHVLDDKAYEVIWQFVLNIADAITVSTPYLKDLMLKRTHKPTYIVPNSVRWDEWQVPKLPRFTIGLTGSRTHEQDWAVLRSVFPEVLARHPDVDLKVVGYVPEWAYELRLDYPEQVILDTGWYQYPQYPDIAGAFHMTLCPLDPVDGFNRSKSAIKAIEAMASGSVVIATDTNVYRPALGHGSRGVLVDQDPEAWKTAILRMIEDSGLRNKLVHKARSYARANHAIDQTWIHWVRAYQAIAR